MELKTTGMGGKKISLGMPASEVRGNSTCTCLTKEMARKAAHRNKKPSIERWGSMNKDCGSMPLRRPLSQ